MSKCSITHSTHCPVNLWVRLNGSNAWKMAHSIYLQRLPCIWPLYFPSFTSSGLSASSSKSRFIESMFSLISLILQTSKWEEKQRSYNLLSVKVHLKRIKTYCFSMTAISWLFSLTCFKSSSRSSAGAIAFLASSTNCIFFNSASCNCSSKASASCFVVEPLICLENNRIITHWMKKKWKHMSKYKLTSFRVSVRSLLACIWFCAVSMASCK